MVVLARSAIAGALLASVSVASPVNTDAKTNKLSKKDVDTRYPYNGPTVVIGMFSIFCFFAYADILFSRVCFLLAIAERD